MCVASKIHKHHDVNDLAIFYENKLEVLKLDIQEFESSIYPKYQESVSDIPNRKAEMIENSQALKANLNEQGRLLHREIDKCIKEMQTEIDDMDAQNFTAIEKHTSVINSTIDKISKSIQDLKKLLDSNDISLISKYKSRNEDFRKLPPELRVSSFKFEPRKIKNEKIRELFGCMIPSNKKFLNSPFIIADGITDSESLNSVSCGNDEGFWTICSDATIRFQNVGKQVLTKSGKMPIDIAVTRSGDLVFTDGRNESINIVSHSENQETIRLKCWIPKYVCSASYGDFLVSMQSAMMTSAFTQVVRFFGNTPVHSFQWDKEKRTPIYKPGSLGSLRLSENKNLNICVADWSAGEVVVVSKVGKLRFRYKGRSSMFRPSGIATDSQGMILISECYHQKIKTDIHILDQDGHFLRFIDNCDLLSPKALCVDSKDNIYVTSHNRVKKIQYYR
uniref:Uncharacterized protein LOC111117271 n=1 Tax=Crassostrea virginica TaxID=6565 RepID=A0A8B8CBH3_CRAVI|nr:uncharacterized protein LOC111117271 [Crassostrea virginica]